MTKMSAADAARLADANAAMVAGFAHAFSAIWEGGVSDDRDDPGGLTMYGCATHFMQTFAATREGFEICRKYGIGRPVTRAEMMKITPDAAKEILLAYFYPGLEELHPALAILTYDARMNCGTSRGDKFLQQAAKERAPTLAVDGIIGPKTVAACKEDVAGIATRAISLRERYYRDLARKRPAMTKFLKGWLNRTGALRIYIREWL